MLKLDDRLRIALGAGMGVQLTSGEVEIVARWLVVLRQLAEHKGNDTNVRLMRDMALHALEAAGLEPA